MIQLYSLTNTNYQKNGDFVLKPTSCKLSATLNGSWELEMEHPIIHQDDDDEYYHTYPLYDTQMRSFLVDNDSRGLLSAPFKTQEIAWSSICEGAVIAAPTFVGEKQLFRIYKITRNESTVTAYARPIFFDSARDLYFLDRRPTGKNGQQALDWMMTGSRYSGVSDITKVESATYIRKNLLEVLCGTEDNSFVNRWGGEAIYDNYTIYLNERAGSDHDVEVLYGKNITGITQEIDMDELATRIYPLGFNGVTLGAETGYIDSPLASSYPIIFTKTIKYENIKMASDVTDGEDTTGLVVCQDQEELDAALQAAVNNEYANGCDKPKVTIKVEMIDLAQMDEYADYQALETVSLGDTVHCRHARLGIVSDERIVSLTWDCIRNTIEQITIGEMQHDYFQNLTSVVQKAGEVLNTDGEVIADRIAGALDLLKIKMHYQQAIAQHQSVRAIIFEDFDIQSPTYGALAIGTQGIEISDTYENGEWVWGTAIDSKTIHAERMVAGVLSDKYGINFWDLETGDFRLVSNWARVAHMNEHGEIEDSSTLEDYVANIASQSTAVVMQLSNDFQGVQPDEFGHVTDCSTSVTVYYGMNDVTHTEACTYSTYTSNDVTGSWDPVTKTYTVNTLGTDSGYVRITATYQGVIVVTKTFSVARVSSGEAGISYQLEASDQVVKIMDGEGHMNVDRLTFHAYYLLGTNVERQDYLGRIKIEATPKVGSKITIHEPTVDEAEVTYVFDSNTPDYTELRVTLYAAGGTEHILDVRTVVFIREAAALTRDEVFNILTNNEAWTGIYKLGNELYINANYIQSGVLKGPNGRNYWNLETGDLFIGGNTRIDDNTTISDLSDSVAQAYSLLQAEELRAKAQEAVLLGQYNIAMANMDDLETQLETRMDTEDERRADVEADLSYRITTVQNNLDAEYNRAAKEEKRIDEALEKLDGDVSFVVDNLEDRITAVVSGTYATKKYVEDSSTTTATEAAKEAARLASAARQAAIEAGQEAADAAQQAAVDQVGLILEDYPSTEDMDDAIKTAEKEVKDQVGLILEDYPSKETMDDAIKDLSDAIAVEFTRYTDTITMNSIINQRDSDITLYAECIAKTMVGQSVVDMSTATIGFMDSVGDIHKDSTYVNWAHTGFCRIKGGKTYILDVFYTSSRTVTSSKVIYFTADDVIIRGAPRGLLDVNTQRNTDHHKIEYITPENAIYAVVEWYPRTNVNEVAFANYSDVQRLEEQQAALSVAYDSITSIVSKKVDGTQVESIIEQKADSIRMKTGRIAWQANNSTMTEEGVFSAESHNAYLDTNVRTRLVGGRINYHKKVNGYYYYLGQLGPRLFNGSSIGIAFDSSQYDGYDNAQAAEFVSFDVKDCMGILIMGPSGRSKAKWTEAITFFNHAYAYGGMRVAGSLKVDGTFKATETKSRLIETKNYGDRLQYCYETPTPMFGDMGSGRTDENGVCYVEIDDIFAETAEIASEYLVFLQKEGPGDLWIDEKTETYFVVKGTPNLSFAWELKAVQKGYATDRLDVDEEPETELDPLDQYEGPMRYPLEDGDGFSDWEEYYDEDVAYEESWEDIYDY